MSSTHKTYKFYTMKICNEYCEKVANNIHYL